MKEIKIAKIIDDLSIGYAEKYAFFHSDINTKRLMSDKWYDKAYNEWRDDNRKHSKLKLAEKLYNLIMIEYERLPSES
jgi:hypothetical protein